MLSDITVSNRYARSLRWRIRKKVQRMKEDLMIAEESNMDLQRRPEKRVRKEEKRFLINSVNRSRRKPRPLFEIEYKWPPDY